MRLSLLSILSTGLFCAGLVSAQDRGVIYDGEVPEELNGFNYTYPWPVKLFRFNSQLQELEMAFMDILPRGESNGKTVILLHGKNFCGPTWHVTIQELHRKGYRVIVPDQIGFCKSSKPSSYQFSLQQLAWNTCGLLDALDVGNVTVIGHSLGGMLAARYSLQYAESVDEMVMIGPVGMEDYVKKGVPNPSFDSLAEAERALSYDSIREYEQATYYVGEWKDSYDTWVSMLIDIYNGSERENYVRNQAQIVEMVLSQPIVHQLKDIKVRTLVMVGTEDNAAIGGQWASPIVAEKLGHFEILGREITDIIPNSDLIEFPGLGHAPQISDPWPFHWKLMGWLSSEKRRDFHSDDLYSEEL
ncbi:hypothetical protein FZEAL_3011 [Fusarium zealandicum]|uniref:AB hydrolase-1 domain-containing protein n=1 Tax=Fusarium zealandicum TaxID=1053134 RepID=A0A8H4UPN3_9HYPO|nr:hypothetical protein FZEAL_3011 [Fusarium zealandicum]